MEKSDKRAFVDSVRNKYAPSVPQIDKERYTELEGLEGPFVLRSGKVVYYDPKEGKYYDRDRDMYMSDDEYHWHSNPRQTESVNFYRFTEILESATVGADYNAKHDFLDAVGRTRQKLAEAHRILQNNRDPGQADELVRYMDGVCAMVSQNLAHFDRKPVFGGSAEFRIANTSLGGLLSPDGRIPQWIEEAIRGRKTEQLLRIVADAEKTLTSMYKSASGDAHNEPMIQKPITWHRESRAPEPVVEYEMHVDDDGYAYDDEGNREYVGKRFRGTYTPRSMRQMRDAGLPTPADAMQARPSVEPDQNKVDALQRAVERRPNDFLSSILAQVKAGRVLTDAQKKAVRQSFYRIGMKGDADLFR